VLAAPLSATEAAHLPRRRRRWVSHVAALLFLAAGLAIDFSGYELAYRLRLDGLPERLAVLGAHGLPGALLLPLFRKVGYRKRDVLFFPLIPIWGSFIAWKVGFRLASLPYRDWPPRRDEYDRCRRLPGSTYHVIVPEQAPVA
jgi:hypothetical protein